MVLPVVIQVFGVGYIWAMAPFRKPLGVGLFIAFTLSELMFVLDIAVGILKVPNRMEEPTLKKTARHYLKKRFIIELFATIVSDLLFMSLFIWRTADIFRVALYLKLLRISQLKKVKSAYTLVIRNYITGPSYVKAVYTKFSHVLFFTFVITHLLTCIWIRIGLWDLDKPEGERQSWIFQTDTDFSEDQVMIGKSLVTRSPYDQLTEPSEKSAGFTMLYFYSLIYILQTITTVGYGNSTYGTYLEYSFALMIESISLVYNALVLVVMQEVSTLQSNNFQAFLDQQMDILDTWLIKI